MGFYGIFVVFGLVSFLVASGKTPTELFVWTGASAALLAFIMQQTLGDVFSGLSLTLERPFQIGDWIRLGDGTEGQVQDINWRATHLRKWDNTTLVIPNGKLARESFTNLHGTTHHYAPWYTVKVSGEHPPAQVIGLLEQAVASCDAPLPYPAPVARLMDANSTPYTYMIWVNFPNYPSMFAGRGELYGAMDETLRAAGIEVAADIKEIRYRQIGPLSGQARMAGD
jgi:small-conductance mechanosensitive channel